MSKSARRLYSLESLQPFLIAANVRGPLKLAELDVASGLGQAGDLVIGQVLSPANQPTVVLDQSRTKHIVTTPQRVVAVLGPRDSSTHVCATIPAKGLQIDEGLAAHWIAGESGIVGCLEREASTDSIHKAEMSVDFRCDGLVVDTQLRPVNIREFAVQVHQNRVSTPIIMISATSSESGKTVLAGKLIRLLTNAGIRVGALKVTGTGGVLDSLYHLSSGAVAALDNVDAGLITTGGEAQPLRDRIPAIFRQIERAGIDLIVAELGGDVVSANNPEVFQIGEIMDNTKLLIVISNDALAAAGFNVLTTTKFDFPEEKLLHFTSPFRNHAGMKRRMAAVGIEVCYDPCSQEDLMFVAKQAIRKSIRRD